MRWTQEGGKPAPDEAVRVAEEASREFGVPVGILLATAECETNFRPGLVSSAGAVGPVQFLPRYRDDYYVYAGIEFELTTWDALRGLAGVYKQYAKWGADRYGLLGEDRWRYAVNSHRYGQNSSTSRNMDSKRVLDVERHMERNGLWYNDIAAATPEEGGDDVSKDSIAAAAARWALGKVGCKYSQAERTKEGIFDCSSLVARAYTAQGMVWGCKGAPVPTSQYEVYDDHFRLLWPADYASIGKTMGGADVLKLATEPGDIQYIHTTDTSRANRITHVTMVADSKTIVHARSAKLGVCTNNIDLYAGKVCAVVRYDPDGPLRQGMQGSRVKALQRSLIALGAAIEADGIYGAKTAEAVQKYGTEPPTPTPAPTPAPSQGKLEITGDRVNVRSGPGTQYDSLGKLNKGDRVEPASDGWTPITYNGRVAYVSDKYIREV